MFQLEKVLGLTVDSNSGFGSSPKTSLYAYVAGSTVVISNISNNQQQHIINQSKKPIKSLAFSNCGNYLVVCEHGQHSAIKIWNIDAANLYQIGEIIPEEHGTKCLAISPDGNCLVTLGYNSTINLWDWRSKTKVAASKTSTEISGISFQEDGRYFVTIGKEHFFYWYFDNTSLAGKSAAIGGIEDVLFSDVACGKGKCNQFTYVVTRNGTLVTFNDQRAVEQLVELEIGVSCIGVNEKYVFVGCQEAIILCFDSLTLDILYALPKCHQLGTDINADQFSGNISRGKFLNIMLFIRLFREEQVVILSTLIYMDVFDRKTRGNTIANC